MSVNFASLYPAGQNDQLLANLDAQAKFGFDKASYMGLNFDAVDTNMNIQKGVANLAPFSTTVNNGTFGFAGKIDFNEDSPTLKLPKPTEIAKGIEVNKETTKKLLKYVNPIFADVTAIKGVANFDCDAVKYRH
jgi:hypothetical protein